LFPPLQPLLRLDGSFGQFRIEGEGNVLLIFFHFESQKQMEFLLQESEAELLALAKKEDADGDISKLKWREAHYFAWYKVFAAARAPKPSAHLIQMFKPLKFIGRIDRTPNNDVDDFMDMSRRDPYSNSFLNELDAGPRVSEVDEARDLRRIANTYVPSPFYMPNKYVSFWRGVIERCGSRAITLLHCICRHPEARVFESYSPLDDLHWMVCTGYYYKLEWLEKYPKTKMAFFEAPLFFAILKILPQDGDRAILRRVLSYI